MIASSKKFKYNNKSKRRFTIILKTDRMSRKYQRKRLKLIKKRKTPYMKNKLKKIKLIDNRKCQIK